MSKRKPTGYVAECQCGRRIGALDLNRTDRASAGRIMGQWVADGCTLWPRFTADWTEHIEQCACAPTTPADGEA